MQPITRLSPTLLWKYFCDICRVPRPSQKEDRIIPYLLDWARKNNIDARKDAVGNILMKKSATSGMEKLQSVVLQSHMDMVCEKECDVQFNFEKDPIKPWVDGDWIKAKGTTLGADNGIGMAAQMAVLKAEDIRHGPIECLFTVDEEIGLTGAARLEKDFFDSKILLNLDSEDEGKIFFGCAGGMDTLASFTYDPENIPDSHIAYRLDVKGLKGGHSGDDIHRGLGNSIKILNRILWHASQQWEFRISIFEGGGLANSIPREAHAVVTIPQKHQSEFEQFFQELAKDITNELNLTEPGLALIYEQTALPEYLIDIQTQQRLFSGLYACPHGVFAMSKRVAGLVETSSNLASVKFMDDHKILVTTSQRSSVESSITDMANMVASVFTLAGATVKHTGVYPGWSPNPCSQILEIAISSYEKLYGSKPVVRAIHAGLECGLFLKKYPELDMISFGPTIRGAHSPGEKIFIPSVLKWWDHLLDVLSKIPEKEQFHSPMT